MRKLDGLKSYAKEKLITGLFVVGVASGRNIVAVQTAVAAWRQSRDTASPSPITFPTANPNVVVKWKKTTVRTREMFSLWGFPDSLAKIQAGKVTPEEAAEAKAKREAEKKVEDEGFGVCVFCLQEIVKNVVLGVWESEFLVGYCPDSRDHKHKPKVVWKTADESI